MWEKYSHIVPHISVGSGIIDTVAGWVVENGYKVLLVVCDHKPCEQDLQPPVNFCFEFHNVLLWAVLSSLFGL